MHSSTSSSRHDAATVFSGCWASLYSIPWLRCSSQEPTSYSIIFHCSAYRIPKRWTTSTRRQYSPTVSLLPAARLSRSERMTSGRCSLKSLSAFPMDSKSEFALLLNRTASTSYRSRSLACALSRSQQCGRPVPESRLRREPDPRMPRLHPPPAVHYWLQRRHPVRRRLRASGRRTRLHPAQPPALLPSLRRPGPPKCSDVRRLGLAG